MAEEVGVVYLRQIGPFLRSYSRTWTEPADSSEGRGKA